MPRIQAYKFAKSLVPVDDCQVVDAYQCPTTEEIFENKKEYLRHLSELRRDRQRNLRMKKLRERMNQMQEDLSNQPDWASVISWVENHGQFFLERAKQNRHWESEPYPDPDTFRIWITYLDIKHEGCVSNYHHCPRNGDTNWGGYKSGVARGYPGWTGRIEYRVSREIPGFASDLFRGTGINTGTGGGTRKLEFGYSVELFDSDWPVMDQQRILNVLSNTAHQPFKYGTPKYFRHG